jgi:hypothetical protein
MTHTSEVWGKFSMDKTKQKFEIINIKKSHKWKRTHLNKVFWKNSNIFGIPSLYGPCVPNFETSRAVTSRFIAVRLFLLLFMGNMGIKRIIIEFPSILEFNRE